MHPEINILGYSGSHMALIFETLSQLKFHGSVRIIMHDNTKYFDVPFQSDIPCEILRFDHLTIPAQNGLFFCSNKPSNKKFLYGFFDEKWNITKEMFTSIIHPSSVIASTVQHKEGLYVEPLTVISPFAKIGFGVSINRHCSIGHHNIIHDYCSIYPGTHITGDVEIGKAVTIGPGTTIFSGVQIGENSVIGGGSVVTRDIPANVLAWGNPCKPVKELYPSDPQSIIT
jgi:UDP-N-acetylbacillosamine N-acetyltransferase